MPSLEDEIFSVASRVEEAAVRRPPLLRWERVPDVKPRTLGAGLAGFATFLLVDAVMMWAPLMSSDRGSLLPQMVTLLVLAFGLGGLLSWQVGGRLRLRVVLGLVTASERRLLLTTSGVERRRSRRERHVLLRRRGRERGVLLRLTTSGVERRRSRREGRALLRRRGRERRVLLRLGAGRVEGLLARRERRTLLRL
ncbi:hypothetical protein ACSNOI_41705, partial [Actinomadura kijaniata]|uniref:hypothetical protein n=1 Tax=Actinomadura kijaniata TaxID=46161 RepID=UPI003F1B1128